MSDYDAEDYEIIVYKSVLTSTNVLLHATFPGAPSYSGVRTWVEGSQTRGGRALSEASNLLGYKEYTQQDFVRLHSS